MSNKKDEIFDIAGKVSQAITKDVMKTDRPMEFRIVDASTKTAEVLIPQWGSDREYLEEGKVDVRRFSNIEKVWLLPLSYFMLKKRKHGGGYSNDWCINWLNLCYSIEAQHKKLQISLQQAVTGGKAGTPKTKDTRNWIQRNVTQRNKKPEELFSIE